MRELGYWYTNSSWSWTAAPGVLNGQQNTALKPWKSQTEMQMPAVGRNREYRRDIGTSASLRKSKFTLSSLRHLPEWWAQALTPTSLKCFPIFWPSRSGLRNLRHSLRLVLRKFVYYLAISLLPFHPSLTILLNRISDIYLISSVWQALS